MTVNDFRELSIDASVQVVKLFSLEKGVIVFEGILDDAPDEYLDEEVLSFDVIEKDSPFLTLNIDAEN